MGDIIDEIGNFMPVPGNGRAKRARIDREGNMVVAGDIYAYDKTVSPPLRYKITNPSEVLTADNVKYYGAVGDGVTDDTAAFTAAVAASDCVYVPDGTYVLSSTLVIPDFTQIRGCSNVPVRVTLRSSANPCVQFGGIQSCLANLNIQYNGGDAVTSVAIDMQGGFTNRCDFVRTLGAAYGVVVDNTQGAHTITNSTFRALVQPGTFNGSGHKVSNCDFIATAAAVNCLLINSVDGSFVNVTALGEGGIATNGVVFSATGNSNIIILLSTTNVTNSLVDNGIGNKHIDENGINSEKYTLENGASFTTGTGVPVAAESDGSLFLRSDGTGTSNSLYQRISGAWVPLTTGLDANNVKFYGAIGDGVTDDTAAFTAALAAVSCVYVPEGTYVVSSTLSIPNGKSLYGCSSVPVNTIINSSASPMVSFGNQGSISRLQLIYTGADAVTSVGIDATAGFSNVVENIRLFASATGLICGGAATNTIRNSVFSAIVAAGVVNTPDHVIENCSFAVTAPTTTIFEISADNVYAVVSVNGSGGASTNGVLLTATADNCNVKLLRSSGATNRLVNNGTNNITLYAPDGINSTEYFVDNGPTISTGTGVPAAVVPNGSLYLRQDGTTGDDSLYMRVAGAWIPIFGQTA